MKRHFLLTLLACLLGVQVFALDYSNENSSYNNNYVAEWGQLKLVGNQLCSENGQPVQLRGWSTHGKQWHGSCFDGREDFEGMKKLGANIARIAMYINEGGWVDLNWIKDCVKWTNELGMYCLVDWHILKPGNPNDGSYNGAENFFRELSQWVEQSGYKNVVYEICNEPNEDTEGDIYRPNVWKQIKEYCEKILPIIANNDPGAVVLVGTPQWDKALVFPMEDPINTYGLNVLYTFHHYTCDQQQFLGILSSAAAFVPVFVSEWGLTEDQGGLDGMVCEDGGDNLMKICNGENLGNQKISWCNWSWSPDGRSSSALNSCGNYSEGNLRQSGKYILKQLRKGDNFSSSSSSPYQNSPQVIKETEDSYIALEKYDEDGQNKAFFEYDDKGWLFDINGTCNAGGEARKDECVDLGVTGKEEPFFYNLGYVVAGEWVKYTVNVEKEGIYEFETYTNNHIDNNVFGICVDGESAIVDENGDDTYKALKLRTSKDGDANDGYGEWGWTTPYSQHKDGKFYIRFKKAGIQTLGISFMSSCAGLGSLKFKALNPTNNISVKSDVEVRVWPNPVENGNFSISLSEDAKVSIVSCQGVCVFDKNLEKGENSINASFPAGVYMLSVKTENCSVVKKLIVK